MAFKVSTFFQGSIVPLSLTTYNEEGLPELIVEKWKNSHVGQPEQLEEFERLRKQKSTTPVLSLDQDKESMIAPPGCFEKNDEGCCRNAGLRTDCGPCFYLQLGRTQEEIDRLIKSSLDLPAKVQQVKRKFLARDDGRQEN